LADYNILLKIMETQQKRERTKRGGHGNAFADRKQEPEE